MITLHDTRMSLEEMAAFPTVTFHVVSLITLYAARAPLRQLLSAISTPWNDETRVTDAKKNVALANLVLGIVKLPLFVIVLTLVPFGWDDPGIWTPFPKSAFICYHIVLVTLVYEALVRGESMDISVVLHHFVMAFHLLVGLEWGWTADPMYVATVTTFSLATLVQFARNFALVTYRCISRDKLARPVLCSIAWHFENVVKIIQAVAILLMLLSPDRFDQLTPTQKWLMPVSAAVFFPVQIYTQYIFHCITRKAWADYAAAKRVSGEGSFETMEAGKSTHKTPKDPKYSRVYNHVQLSQW